MSSSCCQSQHSSSAIKHTHTQHGGCGCAATKYYGHNDYHHHSHDHVDGCGCEEHPHIHAVGEPHHAEDAGCGCGCGHDRAEGAANESFLQIIVKNTEGRLALGYAVILGLAYGISFLSGLPARLPLLVAMGLGLVPMALQAWKSLKGGNPFSIQLLMIIAATGATVVDAEHEAAVVILLFLIGEVLEAVAARRAQLGIQKLVDLVPQEAHREQGEGIETVLVEELCIGDVVRVGSGQRIPVDGQVIGGISTVDESPLTGESVPKPKAIDDAVLAGSVNKEGELRVQVAKDASDNAIARVARLVQEARVRRAPVQRFIARFAKYYTPMISILAVAVAVVPPLLMGEAWHEWIYKASALLLIACPCALVISTPASLASALSAGAGRGLLLKGGDVLEALADVDTVAFDKTGTLTEGRPLVASVLPTADQNVARIVALAAGLSVASRHPVAQAVLAYAAITGVEPEAVTDVTALPGQGVQGIWQGQDVRFGAIEQSDEMVKGLQAEGHIVSALSVSGQVLGYVSSRDMIRPEAAQGVKVLKELGLNAIMLTGDSRSNAERVANHLGVECHAALLPEDKMKQVQTLQEQGARVVKVGDGINDAPALAEASVGIAFGGGTDVALETADAASINNRVTDVANMVWLAKSAMRNIRQNIVIALGLKAVFLVTTIAGLTGLWPAIMADTGATVLVTANALRLLRHKPLVLNS